MQRRAACGELGEALRYAACLPRTDSLFDAWRTEGLHRFPSRSRATTTPYFQHDVSRGLAESGRV